VNCCSNCEFSHFFISTEVDQKLDLRLKQDKTVYNQLRPKWDYLNIWWNDADFIIILAFLTIGDEITAECARLLRRLAHLRFTDVLGPRDQACRTNSVVAVQGLFSVMALAAVTSPQLRKLLVGSKNSNN
jgi:hypothetical protein